MVWLFGPRIPSELSDIWLSSGNLIIIPYALQEKDKEMQWLFTYVYVPFVFGVCLKWKKKK